MKTIKWTYKVIEITKPDDVAALEENLNLAGNRGWEMVGIFTLSKTIGKRLILKKPCGFVEDDLK